MRQFGWFIVIIGACVLAGAGYTVTRSMHQTASESAVGSSAVGSAANTTKPSSPASGGVASSAQHGSAEKVSPASSGSPGTTPKIPLFGASIARGTLPSETAKFGHLPIVRVYYPGLPAANAWTSGLAGANESAVIVSFKALPKTILSGADDAVLSHFFGTAPTGHPIYWSYWHEPENDAANGAFTPADYRAAWVHVAKLAGAAHNPDLHATLILMSYDFHPGVNRNWKDFFPGSNVIDVLAWDGYPKGSTKNINQQLTPPGDFMAPGIAAARSVGLPFGFAEFALSTPAGRPGWLKEVANYLIQQGALFGSLFQGYHNNPAMILNDTASIAVWRDFVGESTGQVSQPGPSPTPTTGSTLPAPSSPAPSGGLSITDLSLSPASFAASGKNHTKITFHLGQAADVTAQIVNSQGAVIRTLNKPGHGAGLVRIPYYGYDGSGHREPAGTYTVRVTASNGIDSDNATATLSITRG